MNVHAPNPPDLQTLIGLFYSVASDLGECTERSGEQIPQPYRQLLDHHEHMTVTVEAFHDSPVDVEVLQVRRDDSCYSRKILLRRQSDGEVVQFGIVRLHLNYLEPAVRQEIESEQVPLGRALISHNVLRTVELCKLYEIECGPDLASLFRLTGGTATFGRTALIHCNGEPAVELLEVVTPCSR